MTRWRCIDAVYCYICRTQRGQCVLATRLSCAKRLNQSRWRLERQSHVLYRWGAYISSQRRRDGAAYCYTCRTQRGLSVPDMELGHWVTSSMGHLGHLSRPGHRVIILTQCETRVFPVFETMPKMQNVHMKCWYDKSRYQVKSLKSLDVSPCNELLLLPMIIKNSLAWEYFSTHKSTFGVRYGTGSPGQLGLRVAGFPDHWVLSQNVTQFHLWLIVHLCLEHDVGSRATAKNLYTSGLVKWISESHPPASR